MPLHLSQLWQYPLKSAAATSLQAATVYAHGLEQDRRWLLVDLHGQMLTQRQQPHLGQLKVHAAPDAGLTLTWSAQTITAQALLDQLETVQVWADQMPAHPVAESVNQQLSAWLGQAVRLVYCPDQAARPVDPVYAGLGQHTAFSDGFPLLLLTQASLDALSLAWGQPIDVRRFRPNLVIGGDCAAFAEDTWSSVQIGDLLFDLVKPCSRCVIPSLDPETQQPTAGFARFLAAQRRQADGKVYLGQNVILRQAAAVTDFRHALGRLQVGDPVHVFFDKG